MTTTQKRNLMIEAHKMAKKMVGDYQARLALALRKAWKKIKNRREGKVMSKKAIGQVYISLGKNVAKVTAVANKNTYENKEKLKEMGYKWDGMEKKWKKSVDIKMDDIDPDKEEDNLKAAKRGVEILRDLQDQDLVNLLVKDHRTKKIIEFVDNH